MHSSISKFSIQVAYHIQINYMIDWQIYSDWLAHMTIPDSQYFSYHKYHYKYLIYYQIGTNRLSVCLMYQPKVNVDKLNAVKVVVSWRFEC